MSYFEFELASNDSIKFIGGDSEEKEIYQFQDVLDNMKEAHTVRIITYTCQICGQDKYLYYEGENMWFVEGLNEGR